MIFHLMKPSLESNFWPTIKIIQKNIFYCKFKIHLHSSPNDATYIFTHLSPNYNWTNIYAILYKVSLCHSNKNQKRYNLSSQKISLHIFVVARKGWIPWLKIAITFLFIGIFDIRSLEKIQWIKLTLGISKLLSNSSWILLWKCGFLLNSCVVIFCITLASFLEWPLCRSDQLRNFECYQHQDVVQTHISSIGQIT